MEAENLARSERLVRLQSLLNRAQRGLTTQEIAERCGVCRRTAQRDLRSLEKMNYPLAEEEGRYSLMPGSFIPPIRLHLEEATALFIAARLLSLYSDEHNPWVVCALEKLAAVLPTQIGAHVARCAALVGRGAGEAYSQVFQVVTCAWARQRKVKIWYRSLESVNVHDYVVAPYFIEPNAVGRGAYLIGHASYFDALRTFKLERIERAEELADGFTLPSEFDAFAWLAGAWGIMGGSEPETVILRFSRNVARRVKESVWHPSQQIEDCPDGAVVFTVTLSEPREMTPWIRGWGAEVVVLAPEHLRARIADDLRRAAAQYASDG